MPKALVIDDSRAMRMIVSKLLVKAGFEVTQAANGREGLEAMEAHSGAFEIALVDWNMPDVNGLEFVERVRARPEWARVRLMMVTTETEMEQVSRALAAGADEYVMKPFTEEALADKVRLLGMPA